MGGEREEGVKHKPMPGDASVCKQVQLADGEREEGVPTNQSGSRAGPAARSAAAGALRPGVRAIAKEIQNGGASGRG
jgi:hypothetical protein